MVRQNNDNGEQRDPEVVSQQSHSNIHCLSLSMVRMIIMSVVFPHLIIGPTSVLIGILLDQDSGVLMATQVAPIWTGSLYFMTGLFGLFAVRRLTPYMLCCFTGFLMVSLLAALISMQLLRTGLVEVTTEWDVYVKEDMDTLTLIGLALSGLECILCVACGIVTALLANYLRTWEGLNGIQELTKEQLMAERQEEIRRQKQQEKKLMQKARLARSYQKF